MYDRDNVTKIPYCQQVSYGIAKGDILFLLLPLPIHLADHNHYADTLDIPTTFIAHFVAPPPCLMSSVLSDLWFLYAPFLASFSLGIPLCRFCSSTVELYPLANHHMLSFYIH